LKNNAMIVVRCTTCGLEITVPSSVQGRTGNCLNCGGPIVVPSGAVSIDSATLSFREGETIASRYIIRSFIGRGGMGVVYLAEDILVKEEVALKFLRGDILRTKKWRYMFLQEAQIARRLRHDNIVAVHDISYTTDGILFLSMEYLKGKSLRDFLKEYRIARKYLRPRLAIAIGLQVLSALDYAHRLVVHRDIKPENIMLLPNEQVKVLDFGVAKVLEEKETEQQALTRSTKHQRTVTGTEAYAAPEQQHADSVDARTDIYSLGLVLRELLYLRTPYEYAPELPIKRDDVPQEILDVVAKSVLPDKKDRWQSAMDFFNALKQAYDCAFTVAARQHYETVAAQGTSMESMVFFSGGSFLMGNNKVFEEAPEAEVHVDPFWMDIHPVTVGEYKKFLDDVGAPEPRYWRDNQLNGAEQPVVGISWEEALTYASWAGKSLPTERQWEFAARGQANRKYPWGSLPPDAMRCNYRNNLGMPSIVSMHEDGQTPEGLFDMAGNVYEWLLDSFGPYTHTQQAQPDPDDGPRKVVRGGCYESDIDELTTTARRGFFANARLRTLGFRCVYNAKQEKRHE
jgi:serine/threonine protein kinase